MKKPKVNVRRKGQEGEREVIDWLQPIVDYVYEEFRVKWMATWGGTRPAAEAQLPKTPKLQRNTLQSDGGGFDITGLLGLAVEVKRGEQQNLNAWWAQTLAQANNANAVPVLLYRKSREPWRAVLYLADVCGVGERMCVTVDAETFERWLYLTLSAALR